MTDIHERFAQELGPGGLEARGYMLESRADSDDSGMSISGIGSPYNQLTRIEGWFEDWDEVVVSGAWKNTISRDKVDIVSTFNHDVNNLLARTTAGTLTLEESKDGLVYRATINPDDPNAIGVHARVARRDVTGASVWFRVVRQEWEEPTEENELEVAKRTILEAELFEVGPVVFPAFSQTTSEAAGFSRLGYTRSSLAAIDGSLRAAGVTRCAKRAAYASRFLADPDSVADDIQALFARVPDLRSQVCDVDPAAAAAASPPQPQVTVINDEAVKAMSRMAKFAGRRSPYLKEEIHEQEIA